MNLRKGMCMVMEWFGDVICIMHLEGRTRAKNESDNNEAWEKKYESENNEEYIRRLHEHGREKKESKRGKERRAALFSLRQRCNQHKKV
jgi:hypothetical protein